MEVFFLILIYMWSGWKTHILEKYPWKWSIIFFFFRILIPHKVNSVILVLEIRMQVVQSLSWPDTGR
jgi:hypothetical protein